MNSLVHSGLTPSIPTEQTDVPAAFLCISCSLRAGDCQCDGPTFRFVRRPAIMAADHPHHRLLTTARDLCEALVRNGFGLTSDRALPGEFDNLVEAIDALSARAEGTEARSAVVTQNPPVNP